jgi:hypothetical protein
MSDICEHDDIARWCRHCLNAEVARLTAERDEARADAKRMREERDHYRTLALGGGPTADRDRLRAVAEAALDLADEGWDYATDYFREKWRCEERIAELRATLDAADRSPSEGEEGGR